MPHGYVKAVSLAPLARWKASLQAQIAQLFEVALRSTAGDLDGASLEPLVATADPRFGDYQCIMARKDRT